MIQTNQPNQEIEEGKKTITNAIDTETMEIAKARSRVTANTPAHFINAPAYQNGKLDRSNTSPVPPMLMMHNRHAKLTNKEKKTARVRGNVGIRKREEE